MSNLLRKMRRRSLPVPPRMPLFSEATLVDSVSTVTNDKGEVLHTLKTQTPVVKTRTEASFVNVDMVDTDMSLEVQQKLGLNMDVTRPYFVGTVDDMSSLEDSAFMHDYKQRLATQSPQPTQEPTQEPTPNTSES